MGSIELLVALTALAYVQSETAPEQHCAAQTNPSIKVTFESRRNGTGYWISQFDVENDGYTNTSSVDKETAPFSVGVEQSTVVCDGRTPTLHSKITLTLSDMNASTKPIPAGYELFPYLGYYKFHADAANWARARQVCAEEGAHLIVINSEYEANVVKQLFTRFPKDKIKNYEGSLFEWSWVGIYEQGANGQYFSILGQEMKDTGYSRWHPGQPSDMGTDDCMLVYAQGAGFNDYPCPYRAPFICEV